jgi:hypothetical protein
MDIETSGIHGTGWKYIQNIYKILVNKSEKKGLLEGLDLCEDNSKMYLEELGFDVVNKSDVSENIEHS